MRLSPIYTHPIYSNNSCQPQKRKEQCSSNIVSFGHYDKFNDFQLFINSRLDNLWSGLKDIDYNPYKNINIEDLFKSVEILKYDFVKFFTQKTGFPDTEKVSQKINQNILNSAHIQEDIFNTKLLFCGYDKNNSVGREMALPGSDCDGLFFVYDKFNVENGYIRYSIGQNIDKRLLRVKINSLPEVFSLEQVKEGFRLAGDAFKGLEKESSPADLKRFSENIFYNGSDFVKAGEFNIKLAKFIPDEEKNFTAMVSYLAEYIRNGKILENNLDNETLELIKNSPLYKYSNITRQEGLSDSIKTKIKERQKLIRDFDRLHIDDKFQLIKDIIYKNYNKPISKENMKYFKNIGEKDDLLNSEMGNIEEMYKLLRK